MQQLRGSNDLYQHSVRQTIVDFYNYDHAISFLKTSLKKLMLNTSDGFYRVTTDAIVAINPQSCSATGGGVYDLWDTLPFRQLTQLLTNMR